MTGREREKEKDVDRNREIEIEIEIEGKIHELGQKETEKDK